MHCKIILLLILLEVLILRLVITGVISKLKRLDVRSLLLFPLLYIFLHVNGLLVLCLLFHNLIPMENLLAKSIIHEEYQEDSDYQQYYFHQDCKLASFLKVIP